MLLFSLGNSRYAIPARAVVEVAPRVSLEPVSMAPDYIAGLFNYRSQHVPVIDLGRLIDGKVCEDTFTSRIMLVEYAPSGQRSRLLGLLAERVTETVSLDEAAFTSTGITVEDAPYLGQAALTEHGLIRKVSIKDLLPERVESLLFHREAG